MISFGPEQFGRLAEVVGEISDAGNVSLDGSNLLIMR